MILSARYWPKFRPQDTMDVCRSGKGRDNTWLTLLAILLLLTTARCYSQATGTIAGLVTDKSGAAIPGAKITVTNEATNQVRKVVADGAGEFTVALLPSGTYSVLIENSGFASSLRKDIVLSANTTVQANGQLEIASVTQQVMVTAGAVMVQTTSTNLVQIVDSRRIEDLPLNGRNVLSLMSINGGVSTNPNTVGVTSQIQDLGTAVTATVNGSRGDATNFLMDNGDNNDLYAKIALPFPNPDAVQEFSFQTASYDARYARAGGVVNVVTKSGGNQWHGSLFEYVRNFRMNAANYFSGLDTLKRNQFGGSLGGPFDIPKLYNGHNRTFFFFSYQGTRLSTATPAAVYTTPSAAMEQGDFSAWLQANGTGQILNPLTGSPFTNNQIPSSQFDPVSVKMMALMPPSSPTNSYQVRLPTPTTDSVNNEFTGRIDHELTTKQHLSGRVFQYLQNAPWTFTPNRLYGVGVGQKAQSRNITLDHTWIISPRWLNDFNFTQNTTESDSTPPSAFNARSLQGFGARVLGVPNQPVLSVTINGWSALSTSQGYNQLEKNNQYSDILNYSNGRHNLRVGGQYQRYSNNKGSPFETGGAPTFSGQLYSNKGKNNAGNAFAEFVMGEAATWIQATAWDEDLTNNYTSLFGQDDWRLTPRLTLNLGLRWNPITDFQEHLDRKGATFIPRQKSVRFPNAPTGLLFLGDPQIKNAVIQPKWKNLAPRIGFAFQVAPETVVRGAYGIFYDIDSSELNNRVADGEPFIRQISLVGPLQLSNPYGSGSPLNPTAPTPDASTVFDPYSTWSLPSKDMPTAYMQGWNLIVERQISSTLVRIGYVGSKGTHLLQTADVNPGIYGPTATASNLNQRRVYQPIGSLPLATDSAYSNYNSLQFTVQKHFSHGFSVLGNYTYGRSIDRTSSSNGNTAGTGPDPFNYDRNRGVSDFDVTHNLAVSGIWELPTLSGYSALIRETLGGWQTNYIFTALSGLPTTIVSGVDNDFSGISGQFADLTGQPAKLSGGRSKTAKIKEWFNTGAFKTNAIGTVGTGSRNTVRDPRYWDIDYSLFKSFPLKDRLVMQFRAEAFNLTNHTNLGAPNSTVTSAGFGLISTASSPRILQLALRMSF